MEENKKNSNVQSLFTLNIFCLEMKMQTSPKELK